MWAMAITSTGSSAAIRRASLPSSSTAARVPDARRGTACSSTPPRWRWYTASVLFTVMAWMVPLGSQMPVLGAEATPGRVKNEYGAPTNPGHQALDALLNQRTALEDLLPLAEEHLELGEIRSVDERVRNVLGRRGLRRIGRHRPILEPFSDF